MLGTQISKFRKNELIFREGDAGDCAYLINMGRVLLFHVKGGVEIPLKILGSGHLIGEMSMIDHSPRSVSCRALGEVHLVSVTQSQIVDSTDKADPIVRVLMRGLMECLRAQDNAINSSLNPRIPLRSEKEERDTQETVNKINLLHQIEQGLKKDEFAPFYQPIYDLNTHGIIGCEALMRWTGADGKIIPINTFIDLLEESPLIIEVGQMMIEKSTKDLVRMQEDLALGPDFFVSVNVSAKQFADPKFVSRLETVRQRTGISVKQLKLEVTERIMMEGSQAISTLRECHKLGYQIAIDDFGTGFSSLQYLASIPLSDLKVDRSFVSQMISSEKPLSIVKTLIYLAGLLNLKLIAEGIETVEQLTLLKNLGVQLGQGFLFSKALPYDDFVSLAAGDVKPKKKAA